MNKKSALLLAAVFLFAGLTPAARAVTINASFQNEPGGQSWTAVQKNVIQQAIADWQTALPESHTINVTFDFTRAGTSGYLGQWWGNYSLPQGTDIYPWTSGVTQTIHLNADVFTGTNYVWWDPTPTVGSDLPFAAWDALSVIRHEIGHMMGITNNFYKDNVGQPQEFDKWSTHISGTVFDPGAGKLNVPLASTSDLAHLLDSGSTARDLMVPALVNGGRRSISATDLNMLRVAYNYSIVTPPPQPTSTSYTLSVATSKPRMHLGDSTAVTATLVNIGTGAADAIDFTGLGATANGGTLSGSSTSGGPLANAGGSAVNAGFSFTSSSAGTYTITPLAATAANHIIGGAATLSNSTPASVIVYTGQGSWNTSQSGSWSNFSNWTTLGGVPGIDGALSAADTATFNSTFSSSATVSLNGASPRLKTLNLNTNLSSFTIARGTGGTLTLKSDSGEAVLAVYSGNNTISAPVVLGSDVWIGCNPNTSLNFAGGISGAHTLTVSLRTISATSIQVGALHIGYTPQPSAVPEPSTSILLGIVAAGILLRFRRRL
jgi:hypothetical protein